MNIQLILSTYKFLTRVRRSKTSLKGREEELQLLQESLSKKRFKNSILVGEAGVGKTALIEEFARKNANDFIVLEMNMGSCLSGTRYRGDLEEKITESLETIISYNSTHFEKPIVLFIDEIHTVMKAGDCGDAGGLTVANLLKPYLSKLDVTIIGATTKSEYEETIKKDKAMKRRLSPIFIKSLEKDIVIRILNEFAEGSVSENNLNYIYEKSFEIENSNNPDSSIEILDRCMARRKITGKSITRNMVDSIVRYLRES